MSDLRARVAARLLADPRTAVAVQLAAAAVVRLTERAAKPVNLVTRAAAVWATRVMMPGRDLADARQQLAAARQGWEAAQADAEHARRELARLQEHFGVSAGRALDPDASAPPFVAEGRP